MVLDFKLAVAAAVDVPVYFGEADCGVDCVTYTYKELDDDGTVKTRLIALRSLADSVSAAADRLDQIRAAVLDRSGKCVVRSRRLCSVVEKESLPTYIDAQRKAVAGAVFIIKGKSV